MNNLFKDIKIQDELLFSGAPILIDKLNILIYQPKLIEYAVCGGQEALQIFLRIISLEPSLEDLNNYPGIKELDIISIIISREKKLNNVFYSFMNLFFKDFNIKTDEKDGHYILLFENKEIKDMVIHINNLDFLLISHYIKIILDINTDNKNGNKDNFNPDSDKAREIKEKMKKGENIRNRIRNKNHSFLFNAISTFAAEQKMPVELVYNNFTLFQFYTQYKRMNAKLSYEMGIKAILAGAKDVEIPNWQEGI